MDESAQHPPAPLSIREKAEQDLLAVRSRLRDMEAKLMEVRADERELVSFIRRLDRYDPPEGDVQRVDMADQPLVSTRTANRIRQKMIERQSHRLVPQLRVAESRQGLRAVLEGSRLYAGGGNPPKSAEPSFHMLATIGSLSEGAPASEALEASTSLTAILAADAAAAQVGAIASLEALHATVDQVVGDHSAAANFRDVIKAIPRPDSRRGRVNRWVYEMMELIGGRVTTKWLVEHIRRSDDDIYAFLGRNPEGTLSSYLSRDPRFVFVREGGPSGWELSNLFNQGTVDQDGGAPDEGSQEGSVSP